MSGIDKNEVHSISGNFNGKVIFNESSKVSMGIPKHFESLEKVPKDKIFKISNGQRVRSFEDPEIVAGGKNFDWNLYQPIECAKIGDKYFVFDGQGRVMMACYRPEITHLPAYVKTHIKTAEQLCEAFINYNKNKKKMTRQDFFIPEATIGVSYAVEFKKAIEEAGWKIERNEQKGNEAKTLYVKEQNRLLEVWGKSDWNKTQKEDQQRKTNVLAALKFAECYTLSKLPSHIPRAMKIICQTYEELREMKDSKASLSKNILEDEIVFWSKTPLFAEAKDIPSGFFTESRASYSVIPKEIKELLVDNALGRDYKEAYIILQELNDAIKRKGIKTPLFKELQKQILEKGQAVLKERSDKRIKKIKRLFEKNV